VPGPHLRALWICSLDVSCWRWATAQKTVLHPGYQEANACDQRCRAQGHYDKGSFAVGLKVVVVHR
jgi:hypothetical protein